MLAFSLSWETVWVIIQVAFGLGFLIFIHELGHFVVAKLCGVKCEKFMVGFDVGGYKLAQKWGETVYGIGIVPLGGYVKMLGQDDDPSKIAEQMERSQVADTDAAEVTGPDGTKYHIDPRSYLAKNVPQRMAIISAGVIMNVLCAFVFAVIAFRIGAPYLPSIVSQTVPGTPAWEADLRTGDEIFQIADRRQPSFSQLTGKVTLADLETGVPMVIHRGGSDTPIELTLKPRQQDGKLARIGILSPSSLRLHDKQPALEGSAADVEDGFEGNDEIIRVAGQPVETHRDLVAQLARHRNEAVAVTVRRGGEENPDSEFAPRTGGEEVTITVPPNARKHLGLVMQTGPIIGVQQNSPAAAAGIEAGVRLVAIDDQRLSESVLAEVRRAALEGASVTLTFDGADQEQVTLTPREAVWLESTDAPGSPLSIPELGIAYEVENRVEAIAPGSSAEQAGMQLGDKLLSAELMVPIPEKKPEKVEIKLGDEKNWTTVIASLQRLPAGTEVKLSYERYGVQHQATLRSAVDLENPTYLVERGFALQALQRIRQPETFQEQLALGWERTVEYLLLVYRFLQKLFESQVPITALGGPVEIAKQAGASAFHGPATLLMFLALLSANLAVVNFLPIPVLDGGHMVFLAYEGLVGRPAPEKFVIALHLAGFALIVSLMAFLLLLDFGVIERNL